MKKLLGMCGLAAALSLVSAMPLLADETVPMAGDGMQAGGPKGDGGPHGRMGFGHKMGGGQGGDWGTIAKFLEVKDRLALTDDQIDKLAEIQTGMKADGADNRKTLGEDFKKLGELVKSKGSDDDITAALVKIKKDKKAADLSREKYMDKIQAVLSPTQQAKLALSMFPMGGGMGHWGKRDKDGKGKPGDDAPPDDNAAGSTNN